MADNVTLPALSGTVATDDVAVNGGSSAQVQYVKLVDGTANGTAGLPGDASNGLDVDVTRIVSGTGATNLGKAEDAAHTSTDVGVAVLAVRRDTQAVGSDAAGDYSTFNVDEFGRLRVSDRNEVSVAATTALATNLVVKGSAGKLFGFAGYTTVAQFIQLHNTSSLPADTAVPVLVFPVEANKPFSIELPRPHTCGTGIVVCNSTTGPTKTIGSANTWITAYYE